jgi:prolyl-tRNA editing enzyme YbaK/EbsC (Cys-tRNA(Pro) deacylase)
MGEACGLATAICKRSYPLLVGSRFEVWLADSGIGLAVKQFPAGTRTAVDAAAAVGCDVGQIVKSLVFVAAGRPVVALVSGANRLDESRLGSAAGTPVTNADAEVARSATGYSIGGVPPFGHATDLPVFMDRDLLGYEVVWAAAGRPDSVFEIDPDRLREMSNATVVELKVVPPHPGFNPTKSLTSRGPHDRRTSPRGREVT